MYITLIIICIIVIVIGALVLLYLINDEKKLKEVDNKLLNKLGKLYTKEDYEKELFNRYKHIIEATNNQDYNFLRDAISDQEYNKVLLTIKNNIDNNINDVNKNIDKSFCKLISFKVNSDIEVSKLWVSYNSVMYTTQKRDVTLEDGNVTKEDVVIKGDKNKKISHEYILTFVKGRSANEDIMCPNCGYHVNLLLNSKCSRCDSVIAPKKNHWVYVGKEVTNISKIK